MLRFNQTSAKGAGSGRRLLVDGRLKIVLVVMAAMLTAGVTAAYAALGTEDTAYGTGALASENGGNYNSAFGLNALFSNTTGISNTAAGREALSSNTTGSFNTAAGTAALIFNTTGTFNTAAGLSAMFSNTTGTENTAVGDHALGYNEDGAFNTAVGGAAGFGDQFNLVNRSSSLNTFLGYFSGPGTGAELNNATAVGANALVSQSDSLVLGASGVNVGVNTTTPKSRLQIGSGATDSFGDYLQIPVVTSEAKAPPAADCDDAAEFGRLVLVQKKKKGTLWACLSPGVWAKL